MPSPESAGLQLCWLGTQRASFDHRRSLDEALQSDAVDVVSFLDIPRRQDLTLRAMPHTKAEALIRLHLPAPEADRLYSFFKTYVAQPTPSGDYNCGSFVWYLHGWYDTVRLVAERFDYEADLAEFESTEPGATYFMRHGEQIVHAGIGISAISHLSVYGPEGPLVVVDNRVAANTWGADEIIRVTRFTHNPDTA